jgi:uncharacterized membrane protein YccC
VGAEVSEREEAEMKFFLGLMNEEEAHEYKGVRARFKRLDELQAISQEAIAEAMAIAERHGAVLALRGVARDVNDRAIESFLMAVADLLEAGKSLKDAISQQNTEKEKPTNG